MDRAAFLFGRDELASGSTAVRPATGTKKPPFPAVFASFLTEGKWCQKRTHIELWFTCYNSDIVDVAFRKGPQKGPQINVI